MNPTVSVICISFNHALYVNEALNSLFGQTYDSVEVIILDDGSTDESVKNIMGAIEGKDVKTVFHAKNQGYTKTFNEGLALSSGNYIVDFALDDVMKPDFLKKSIEKFEAVSDKVGVIFSNADYIDGAGKVIENHTQSLVKKSMIKEVPTGDVFEWILKRYFICTPTMVIKREVFDRLGGYDESLAYEDFDFWVRSSRFYEYAYLNEVLMNKRKLQSSMSSQRYRFHFNEQMNSVFKVCEKAFHLVRTKSERKALQERLNYEYRQCIRLDNYVLAEKYRLLMEQAGVNFNPLSQLAKFINRA